MIKKYLTNKYYNKWLKNNEKYYDEENRIEQIKQRKEHTAEWHKQYDQTPRGKAAKKAARHNRRAMTKGLTLAIIQSVYEDNIKKYGRLTCILCFKPIEFGDDSLEHLTPLSRGGSNDFNNLGVAHRSCNNQKYTMTMDEWKDKK